MSVADINTYLRNGALTSGNLNPVAVNTPAQYDNRQRQYFDPETRAFTQKVAQYSSDFVVAQVQGIDESNPTAWGTYRLRFADVVRPTAAIQRHYDDYKQFLFESKQIEYVRPGTKIVTMGSTWLVINPQNVSGSSGSGLVRRCNAIWNYYDYYGNVVSEPIVVENARANANDSDSQASQYVTKGYFNVICQYNDFTRQIDTNTRLILGTGAYRVTGYSDFEQEFTGDYSTVRLLSFTVRYEEPNDAIDDMDNHIAGGKTFSIATSVFGSAMLNVGGVETFIPSTNRNGEGVSEATYLWSSSNESVATVDENGVVTGVASGNATITATLEQNPSVSGSLRISVSNVADGVRFLETPPQSIAPYSFVTIYAAYYEDGKELPQAVEFSFSGADKSVYVTETEEFSATITSYGYSDTPLTVTASYGAYSVSAQIELEGF